MRRIVNRAALPAAGADRAALVAAGADPAAVLAAGLQALRLEPSLAEPLLAYLAQLVKWNAAYNLTSVRDPVAMVTRHLLDSLAILPGVDGRLAAGARLIDVGSGAGLPGIPLAIARPEWAVAVLDSNGKKARFLRHAQRTLGLNNVEVVEARAEAHVPAQPYDAVVSRAFTGMGEFVEKCRHLLTAEGCWLAMKGRLDGEELAEVTHGARIEAVIPLTVPGLPEQRHLVVARRHVSPVAGLCP